MKNSSFDKGNRLIHRALFGALPPSFASTLSTNFSRMVDIVLAGIFLSPVSIACIGLGRPVSTFLTSIADIFGQGAGLSIAINIGRGDKEQINRTFSVGSMIVAVLCAIFTAFTIIFARPLIVFLGGEEEEVIRQSAIYMSAKALGMIFITAKFMLMKIIRSYGMNGISFMVEMVAMASNILFSVLLVTTTDLGIGALGLGTAIADFIQAAVVVVIIFQKKIGIRFVFCRVRWQDIKEFARLGLPSSGDRMASSFSSGIVNKLLIANLDIMALTVYSVANSIYDIFRCVTKGAGQSVSPLFGLMYGARDRNGIKQSFKSAFGIGFVFTIAWGTVVLLTIPLWLMVFGSRLSADVDLSLIYTGIYIMSAFFPFNFINQLFDSLCEATDRFWEAVAHSILPDSLLFPMLLFILLPVLGYNGLWLAFGLSFVVFYLVYFVIITIRSKRFPNFDDILNLPKDIRENVPKIDITVDSDKASVSGISNKVQTFLLAEGVASRTAYMSALCLEELAADMVKHTDETFKHKSLMNGVLDIKVFVDNGTVDINIRNAAGVYNPLDFEFDDESFSKVGVVMVRRVAKKIEYNYMYKMNVIDIAINN